MSNYPKNVQQLSRKERIDLFKQVSLEVIAKGAKPESMKEALLDMVEDELYEAAQGIAEAMQQFDGQLKLNFA